MVFACALGQPLDLRARHRRQWNAQLFLLSANGVITPLTTGYEQALHMFGAWSAAGQRILFSANRRDVALFDLYVQSLDGEAQMIWRNETPGVLWRMVFSPDEQHVAVMRLTGSFDEDVFEIELATGGVRQLNPRSEQARYEAITYTPDGKSLLVNTDFQSDFMHMAQIDLDSCRSKRLSPRNTIWNG